MQRILGTSNGRLYEQMETVCDQLQERILEIRNERERSRTKHAWLHSAKYHDGKGRVTLRFHDLLAPVLLQLKEQFCKVPLKAIFQLRGSYAIRWLEMLLSQQHVGSWEMTVAELRDWLNIADDDLVATGHVVSRAIEYPRKELDEKSHLSFDYEPRRQGKSIAGWKFTVRANKPTKKLRKVAASSAVAASGSPTSTFPFEGFKELKEKLKAKDDAAGNLAAPKLKENKTARRVKVEATPEELAAHAYRKAASQAQLDLINDG